jgi:hypothetical protein
MRLTTILLLSLSAQAATIVYVGKDGSNVGVFGRDYLYTITGGATTPGANWYQPTFDHSAWATGLSQFGNAAISGGDGVKTSWGVNSAIHLYKEFTLGQAIPMVAKIAVDNAYQLYINGELISSADAGGFTGYWEYSINVPALKFKAGVNWIGLRGIDYGGATALDFALVGDEKGQSQVVPEAGTFALGSLALAALCASRNLSKPKVQ